MRVQIFQQHFIDGRLYEPRSVIDLPTGVAVTPYMVPLDEEARQAVAQERIRVFGRWELDSDGGWYLLDDPPLLRPLTDNQPVPPIPGEGGPGR